MLSFISLTVRGKLILGRPARASTRKLRFGIQALIILCSTLRLEAAFSEDTSESTITVKIVQFEMPDQPIGVSGLKVHFLMMSPNVPVTSDDGKTELQLPRGWKAHETKLTIQLDARHPASREWFISGPADRIVVIPNCRTKAECYVILTVQRLPKVVQYQEKAQTDVDTRRNKSNK